MKCSKCGFENKDKAKFCTNCGSALTATEGTAKSDNSRYIIIALLVVIIILVGTVGYLVLNDNGSSSTQSNNASQPVQSDNDTQNAVSSELQSDEKNDDESVKTTTVSSSAKTESKKWVSIGSYSGSGTGTKDISVPEGKIKVKLSAHPIKNYATNHLYVSGSNGESGGVDWGSKSPVETRSDSFTYTSSSEELFTIDYYETVSWEVEFFRYQ